MMIIGDKWVEMRWNELKWVKMSWNELKWDEMRWDEIKLNVMKWVEMIWNEPVAIVFIFHDFKKVLWNNEKWRKLWKMKETMKNERNLK